MVVSPTKSSKTRWWGSISRWRRREHRNIYSVSVVLWERASNKKSYFVFVLCPRFSGVLLLVTLTSLVSFALAHFWAAWRATLNWSRLSVPFFWTSATAKPCIQILSWKNHMLTMYAIRRIPFKVLFVLTSFIPNVLPRYFEAILNSCRWISEYYQSYFELTFILIC